MRSMQTFFVRMKLVPIAKELETASERPMYLSSTISEIAEMRSKAWYRCERAWKGRCIGLVYSETATKSR